MKMKSVQYYAPLDIRYEEVEVNDPSEDEVLIKIKAALTCGTDVKTYRRGHPVLIKSVPSGFGHEFSGIIEKVGKNIKDFKPGDRVVAANSAPCMKCFFCQKGEYNLCENIEFLNGAFAEYITVPARIVKHNLIKIPDDLPFELATFVEPLANVVHGIERTGIKAGQTVGVVGIGPIGLMFVKLAKLKGARVIAAGRNPLKLKLAKEFGGADEVIDLKACSCPEEAFKSLTEEGKGLDVVIEAVGLPEIWERVFSLVRRGGTVHLFGGCKSGTKVQIDTKRLHYDEISVISVFHHTPKYVRLALKYIAEGKIDVSQLITHRMPLPELQKAIELHEKGEAIKVLIET